MSLNESTVEDAALGWFSDLGYAVGHGPELTPACDTRDYHLKILIEDSELREDSVVRNLRRTAADGNTNHTEHYNLSAIIAA